MCISVFMFHCICVVSICFLYLHCFLLFDCVLSELLDTFSGHSVKLEITMAQSSFVFELNEMLIATAPEVNNTRNI